MLIDASGSGEEREGAGAAARVSEEQAAGGGTKLLLVLLPRPNGHEPPLLADDRRRALSSKPVRGTRPERGPWKSSKVATKSRSSSESTQMGERGAELPTCAGRRGLQAMLAAYCSPCRVASSPRKGQRRTAKSAACS